jgi:diacylglycerol kinase family enzyme
VFAVNARTGKEAAQLVARSTFGVMNRDPRVHQFTTKEFVVTSRSGHAFTGIDGEALDLETPLTFESRPSALRIRVPHDSFDRLRKRQGRTLGVKDLLRVALGHPLNQKEQA